MPRDVPVGNGQMLVTFDRDYQIRDFYYPYVGQENHAAGGTCRFGVYADGVDGAGERLVWTTDQGWFLTVYWCSWIAAMAIWNDLVPKSLGWMALLAFSGLVPVGLSLVVDRYRPPGE